MRIDLDVGALGWVAGAAVVVAVVAMTAAALWARRLGRVMVVDVAWGATFAAVALAGGVVAGLVAGHGPEVGGGWRRWLLTVLVVLWGLRLAWHLFGRVRSAEHDDPRYTDLLGGPLARVPFRRVVGKVFALQGAAVVIVSAPVLVGQVAPVWSGWLVLAGALLWLVGLVFEAVGDAQLRAYRRDSDRRPVLDTGLWAWTRHPNYFGDACVWWGLWLAGGAASGWGAALATLPAPAVMTWFLVVGSGARPTERRMTGRPGWAAYEARTSMFVPWPPKWGRRRPRAQRTAP